MLIQARTWGDAEDFGANAFFELHPDLAEGWQVSSDGRAYTFDLRDDIEWSDGTPVTCNDVKWSFDIIRTDPGVVDPSPRMAYFRFVDSIECPDDLTVVFNLSQPQPSLIEIISLPYHIIRPAHVYEGTDFKAFREEPPSVTSGPFTFYDWVPGEFLTLDRNDDYWDEPFPYLDGIRLKYFATSAIPTALRTGQLHVGIRYGYNGSRADTLLQECTEMCQFWDRVIGSSFSPALFINNERGGWMEDRRVHEAFALAIDNQDYITDIRRDWYELPVGCGFHPTSAWAMPRERCGQIPGFADVVPETREERAAASAADKERARALLRQAGYTTRTPLEVTLTVWAPIQDDVPAFLSDLEAIGVEINTDIQQSAPAYGNWWTGNFDFGLHSFWIVGIDPDVMLYEHFYAGGDRNYNRYSSPRFESLFDEMSRTMDFEERRELAWQAMEVALNDQAKIIVAHASYMPVFSADVRGLMPSVNYLAWLGPKNRYDHVWLAE